MKIQFHPAARRALGAAVLISLFSGAAAAQPATDFVRDAAFEAAQASYERNHWPEAYAAFAALADRGHAEAARIALQMVRRGPALYGAAFKADAEQLHRWAQLATCVSSAGSTACSVAQRSP